MNEYDKEVFARNLIAQMDVNNRTRGDICAYLGVSKATVSDWCSAKKIPRMDKIEALARYFGVKKSELIEETSPAGGMTGEADAQRARIEKAIAMLSAENKEQLLQYAEFLAQQEAKKGGQ